MVNVVPESNHRAINIVFIAQCAQTRRTQHEDVGIRYLKGVPSRCQHPQEVSARKEQDVSLHFPDATHHTVRPRGDLLRRFASWAAVAEQLPVWTFRVNLRRPETFIFAIVPFDQVVIDFGCLPEASQFAGARSTVQGTRKDLREDQSGQPSPKPAGVAFATLG